MHRLSCPGVVDLYKSSHYKFYDVRFYTKPSVNVGMESLMPCLRDRLSCFASSVPFARLLLQTFASAPRRQVKVLIPALPFNTSTGFQTVSRNTTVRRPRRKTSSPPHKRYLVPRLRLLHKLLRWQHHRRLPNFIQVPPPRNHPAAPPAPAPPLPRHLAPQHPIIPRHPRVPRDVAPGRRLVVFIISARPLVVPLGHPRPHLDHAQQLALHDPADPLDLVARVPRS